MNERRHVEIPVTEKKRFLPQTFDQLIGETHLNEEYKKRIVNTFTSFDDRILNNDGSLKQLTPDQINQERADLQRIFKAIDAMNGADDLFDSLPEEEKNTDQTPEGIFKQDRKNYFITELLSIATTYEILLEMAERQNEPLPLLPIEDDKKSESQVLLDAKEFAERFKTALSGLQLNLQSNSKVFSDRDSAALESLIQKALSHIRSLKINGITTDERPVFDQLNSQIEVANELMEQVKGKLRTAQLDRDRQVETDANTFLSALNSLVDTQVILIEGFSSVAQVDAHKPIVDALKGNIDTAVTVAPARISTVVKTKADALKQKLDETVTHTKDQLENKQQREAAQKKAENTQKAIDEVKKAVKKATGVRSITEVNEPNFTYKQIMDEYLEPLKKAEELARAAGEDPAAIDYSFNELLTTATSLAERAEIREMDFPTLVSILARDNREIYMSSEAADAIPDKKLRALIKRFQTLYFTTAPDIKESNVFGYLPEKKGQPVTRALLKEARTRQSYLKSYLSALRYVDKHTPDKVPACDQVDFEAFIKRQGHDDLLDGVTYHPEYGEASRKALTYMRDLIADRVTSLIDGKTAKELGLHYDQLAGKIGGPAKVKQHVEEVRARGLFGNLSPEHLDVVFNLFEVVDGPGDSLALLQKGMKTRSHNFEKDKKVDFASWPIHIGSHMRNRYGPLNHGWQYLLTVTGKYPEGSVGNVSWAGNEVRYPDRDYDGNVIPGSFSYERTTRETQDLLIKYQEMYYGLDGIKNKVFPGDQGPEAWDQSTFPSQLDYLLESLATTSGEATPELYLSARNAWENILDLVMGEIKGPLTDAQIFNSGGYLDKFVGSSGIGGAKMVKKDGYCHYNWFAPLLGYFIARLGRLYEHDGAQERKEFSKKMAAALRTATSKGKGMDLVNYDKKTYAEIMQLIEMIEKGENRAGAAWNGVPEIFVPRMAKGIIKTVYRRERIEFAKSWFVIATRDRKTGHSHTPPTPPAIGQVGLQKALNPDHQKIYDLYFSIIDGNLSAEQREEIEYFVASRKETSIDTAKGSKP